MVQKSQTPVHADGGLNEDVQQLLQQEGHDVLIYGRASGF